MLQHLEKHEELPNVYCVAYNGDQKMVQSKRFSFRNTTPIGRYNTGERKSIRDLAHERSAIPPLRVAFLRPLIVTDKPLNLAHTPDKVRADSPSLIM
jgi:hypothetical protein